MAQLPVEEIARAVSGAVTSVLAKIEASGSSRVGSDSSSEDFEPSTKKKKQERGRKYVVVIIVLR